MPRLLELLLFTMNSSRVIQSIQGVLIMRDVDINYFFIVVMKKRPTSFGLHACECHFRVDSKLKALRMTILWDLCLHWIMKLQ